VQRRVWRVVLGNTACAVACLVAVAQRGGIGAARRGEQPRDLVASQDLRQALALARRAQVGGGVVLDDVLAPQVPVERAQAGRLALQGRRGYRRAPVAAGRFAGGPDAVIFRNVSFHPYY